MSRLPKAVLNHLAANYPQAGVKKFNWEETGIAELRKELDKHESNVTGAALAVQSNQESWFKSVKPKIQLPSQSVLVVESKKGDKKFYVGSEYYELLTLRTRSLTSHIFKLLQCYLICPKNQLIFNCKVI